MEHIPFFCLKCLSSELSFEARLFFLPKIMMVIMMVMVVVINIY